MSSRMYKIVKGESTFSVVVSETGETLKEGLATVDEARVWKARYECRDKAQDLKPKFDEMRKRRKEKEPPVVAPKVVRDTKKKKET